MADPTYYAWSPIHYDSEGKGEVGAPAKPKTLAIGEVATKAKLGIDDENFAALVEAGSVRERKPPDTPDGYSGSHVQFLLEQAREAELMAADTSVSLGGSYYGPNAEDLAADALEEANKK